MYNRFIASSILLLVLPVHAASVPSPKAVQTQQNDQAHCVEVRMKQCVDKCEKTSHKQCKSLCQKNITNECRWAGE